MVYFIFDNPADKSKMEFLYEFETREYKQVYAEHQLLGVKDMSSFVKECISKTTEKDQLVFWYDFMGIICWWICKLTQKKRKIVILNILLKDKKSKKNALAKILYKRVLNDKNVVATVTSKEYGEWLNRLLGIKRDFPLIHDIYYGDAVDQNDSSGRYVFCGGRNGRDWNTLMEIAKEVPDVSFKCVMPKSTLDSLQKIPDNVEIQCDIPEQEFLNLLRQSLLVAMPLDTDAPAGLIALFQAGMYKKLVITSNTPVTREYISKDSGVLCSSKEEWICAIQHFITNTDEGKTKAESFNEFLNKECSKEIYAKELVRLVRGE
ncbi:MAG: hypothetical protein ACI4EF_06555 [Coprococcus sp.]